MNPRTTTIEEKILVGMHVRMSVADAKLHELWPKFMPRRNEAKNRIEKSNFYSVQIHDGLFNPQAYTPKTEFERWAAVAVADKSSLPEGMEFLIIPAGKYAIFEYKGLPQNFAPFWEKIYLEWLPTSDYLLDERPYFELLEDGYNPNDPEAEEEIWVPITAKS